MKKKGKAAKRQAVKQQVVVVLIEYRVPPEDMNMAELLDYLRGNGSARVIMARVEEGGV